MNIGIVIPCYNRVDSLNRLLVSLEGANYLGEEVDLIFSICLLYTSPSPRDA